MAKSVQMARAMWRQTTPATTRWHPRIRQWMWALYPTHPLRPYAVRFLRQHAQRRPGGR
jgi:hypothetical protein